MAGKSKAKVAFVKLRTMRLKTTPASKLLPMGELLSRVKKRGVHMGSTHVESWIDEGELDGFARDEGNGVYRFTLDTVDQIVLNLYGKKK